MGPPPPRTDPAPPDTPPLQPREVDRTPRRHSRTLAPRGAALAAVQGFSRNAGMLNSQLSTITSQDKLKVLFAVRTLAASWGSRSARPIGRARVRSGCLNA
eukprot:9380297-Pyramimonas_sp.AAC.1